MADLLAIIEHDGSDPSAERFDRLIADYEALRGAEANAEVATAPGVRACVLRRTPAASGGIERNADGWTAWAGSIATGAQGVAAPPAELDGQFALVRAKEREMAVTLAADPLGMKPLYAALSGGATYVSTSVLVLARHLRATPSRLGLESFLRSGLQFGRATQWQGIERLQPAEQLRFTTGKRAVGVYWQPELEEAIGRLSLADAAELCVERGVAAIAARYRGERPWLDLTGGFDSRLLALLARRAGVEFSANTVGEEGDEDVRLATHVARQAGWPWTRLHLPAGWTERLPALAAEAVAWGDGHLDSLSLATVLHVHREKAKTGGTTLLNGGGGEEFRDHPWGHELLAAGRSTAVSYDRLLAWRILLPVDLLAMRDDPTPAVAAAMRAELERRAAPFADMPNTFQGDVLYALKMTGHSGAYQAAAGDSIDLEVPFYLHPILLSVISVAPRQRRFHRLMREMIRQLDPAIAAIQTETGGPAEPPRIGNLHRFAPYAWRRSRRFGTRLRGRLPRFGDAAEAGQTPQPQAAKAALIGAMRAAGRLDPGRMRSASLYDPRRLGELLDRAAGQAQSVDWEAVGRIVTVELALEAADAGLE